MLGTRTLNVTYPLLAFALTKSPTWTAWVVFSSTIPALLCYPPAGTLIDRWGPGRVMAISDSARGVLMGALFCFVFFEPLPPQQIAWILLGVAFLEGGLSVISSVAETALIPAITLPHQRGPALALHETTMHAVVLAGRPLGGALHSIGPSVSFIGNAIAFASSATMLWRVRVEKPKLTSPHPPVLRQMRKGLTELWANRPLRAATLLTAVINLFVQCLIVVFITYQAAVGVPTAVIGAILAASGVGGVIGALVFPKRASMSEWLGRRFQRAWLAWLPKALGLTVLRSTLRLHAWVCALALCLIFLTGLTPASFAVALLMIGMAGGLSNVTVRTLLSDVPARVVSVSRLGSYSTIALGPVMASLLYESTDAHVAVGIMTGSTLALALLLTVTTWTKESRTTAAPIPHAAPDLG